MALGCVRVDLTVRLGRGVEGLCGAATCILRVALHVSIRVVAGALYINNSLELALDFDDVGIGSTTLSRLL